MSDAPDRRWRRRSPRGSVRRRRSTGRESERGSGTVLTAAVLVVLLALLVAGATLGRYLVALHQARTAADLAALAGAGAYREAARDADPGPAVCRTVRQVAQANRARVTRCDTVGDVSDFVVTVQTAVDVGTRVPGLPTTIPARALAGPVIGESDG